MRFKFKPNVSAPRGSSTAGTNSSSVSAGVGGETGGGGEVRKKRRRHRSRGDESAGTEGESSSELETGETSTRRRQRKTSEGSSTGRGARGGGGQQQSAVKESTTAKTPSSQSSKDNDPERAKSTQSASITVDGVQTDGTQSSMSLPQSASQVESGSSENTSIIEQAFTGEKAIEELQITCSSAGQLPSSAGSQLHTLSSPLTRGNAVAATSGRTVPKIKKKVAPKVVSSRPKRTPRSLAAGTVASTSECSQSTSSQQQQEAADAADRNTKSASSEERDQTSQRARQKDDSSSPHRTRMDCKNSSTKKTPTHTRNASTTDNSSSDSRAHSDLANKIPTNQTSDEAISSTLNEVLHNTHSQEPEDTGLTGIVPASRLGLLAGGGLTTSDGDTVVITCSTSEESRRNEVEVRTAESNDKSMASLESDESFIIQSCTDVTRTTSISESPPLARDKTGQTRVSSSPSSSQEPRTSTKSSSRRGGSVGPRSRRSESRSSSVCSEAGGGEGEGGKEVASSASKGKRRQKRKKPSADSTPTSNESGSRGASPSPKRSRVSAAKVREAPDRSTMTMQELIYYNPSANPMSSSMEERKKKREDGQSVSGRESRSSSVQPSAGSRATTPINQDGEGGAGGGANTRDDDSGSGRIVPTLRIGVDGKIIVDESSMVMATTEQEPLEDVGEVILDSIGHTTSASYRQRIKISRWTKEETNQFFKALSQVGTDFTMMTLLIPKRSRRELKNKFKKEERSNPHLVSQALSKT